VMGEVGADRLRVALAAVIEAAYVVAHAGLGLFGFGVSQQQQAHDEQEPVSSRQT
jgi:hypothetical protein